MSGPGAPRHPITYINLTSRRDVAPLFTCLGPTGPRGRVCHPHAAWTATKIRHVPRMGPDAPVWTPIVCSTRRKPGAKQPEQYAPDPGIGQIQPGTDAGPERLEEEPGNQIKPGDECRDSA
jgi:hypothetical protein